MKGQKFIIFLILTVTVLFSIAASHFNLRDEPTVVAFKKPKGFPQPLYDLKKNHITTEGFNLGRKLFYDPILSKDSSVSCGSCHQQFAAFAQSDHSLSHGFKGAIGKRNAPALQNLIWKDAFMLDGGVNHLDMQPISPITNPLEMNESLTSVLKKLQRNKEYSFLFMQVYNDSVITSERLLKSLSQFLALLISADSRYDRYKQGKDTFRRAEKNGLKLFRANCAACHAEPLFTDNSYRNNGIGMHATLKDSGRLGITGIRTDLLKFKVPGLRNIGVTNPYMHDGRFYSLKQVLNHYTKINPAEPGIDPLLKKRINLNEQEKTDIIAFLRTLTDTHFLKDLRFANPTQTTTKPQKTMPDVSALSEEEQLIKYKMRWDTVRLEKINNIPQYGAYLDALDKILQEMTAVPKQGSKNFVQVKQLSTEFLNSKKHKQAIKDYITYGQPENMNVLLQPCLIYLNSTMKEGGSVSISNSKIEKVSKGLWFVALKYHVKNKPAKAVKKQTFTLQYDQLKNTYFIFLKPASQ